MIIPDPCYDERELLSYACSLQKHSSALPKAQTDSAKMIIQQKGVYSSQMLSEWRVRERLCLKRRRFHLNSGQTF